MRGEVGGQGRKYPLLKEFEAGPAGAGQVGTDSGQRVSIMPRVEHQGLETPDPGE